MDALRLGAVCALAVFAVGASRTAHDHVKSCPSKAPGADTYFGTKQQFAAAQNEKRRKQVSEFLNKLSPVDRCRTLAAIRNDLADLGIQLC
jgi:hypothetical protein